MKLELALLAGPESKEFLASLTKQVDRLDKLAKKIATGDTVPDEDEDEDEELPKAKGKKAKVIEEDDEDTEETDDDEDEAEAEEETEDDSEEDDEDEPAPKKGKSKKLTADDCNDAAKTLAKAVGGKPGREAVLKLMKKKFKTESVSELKPEQYAAFVKAMTDAREAHEEE